MFGWGKKAIQDILSQEDLKKIVSSVETFVDNEFRKVNFDAFIKSQQNMSVQQNEMVKKFLDTVELRFKDIDLQFRSIEQKIAQIEKKLNPDSEQNPTYIG